MDLNTVIAWTSEALMKRIYLLAMVGISALVLTGCIGLSIGGGTRAENQKATLGQQLIDLQSARNTGAISEAEYQAQKAKLLRD